MKRKMMAKIAQLHYDETIDGVKYLFEIEFYSSLGSWVRTESNNEGDHFFGFLDDIIKTKEINSRLNGLYTSEKNKVSDSVIKRFTQLQELFDSIRDKFVPIDINNL